MNELLDEIALSDRARRARLRESAALHGRAIAAHQRLVVRRAVDLGRAIERVQIMRSYVRSADPVESARGERIDAHAIGQARGHLARLLLDELPAPGYESDARGCS